MSEPATTTTGIYCKKCGYDLRASTDAKRCPECGRTFFPNDPTTFRNRPFAAPWKRALARWTKRIAILLLTLMLLLAGLWGWLYWGWREERAAIGDSATGMVSRPVVLGGTPGQWLLDHRYPGSFVQVRVRGVELVETATDADLQRLWKLRWMETLLIDGGVSDTGVAYLRRCPQLRMLQINSCPRVTDAGLETLRELPLLEKLILSEISVTDAGLVPISTLAHLQLLYLDQLRITDAGLLYLSPLGKLTQLSLSDTAVTDAGLVHLARLPLRYLHLDGTRVTGSGLVHLSKLATIRELNLAETEMTDANLVHLEPLRELYWLDLGRTQVTDAGLVHLEKLRTLKYLSLWRTNITPAGIARLRAALPTCQIEEP